jgi:hypothetical protein
VGIIIPVPKTAGIGAPVALEINDKEKKNPEFASASSPDPKRLL